MKELMKKTNQTPIEIMLKVDQEGKTTAKALYEFLELNKSNYAKWCKKNILENDFAEENIDYIVFVLKDENPQGGRPTTDYKLTASFAKKLAMSCQNERGEQAREYFLKVEQAEGLNQPFVLENFQALEGKKEIDDINQITYFTIAENDVWIYYIINENSNKLHSVLFMINNDKLNEINYLNAYTYFLIASAALDPEPKSDDFEKNLNLSDYSKIKENGLYDTQKARYVKMLTEDNYLLSIEAK